MNIKDKNKKNLLIALIAIFVFCIFLCLLLTYTIVKKYRLNMIYFCNGVINNVYQKYPNAEEDIIKNIFMTNSNSNNDILLKYGINKNNIDFKVNFFDFYSFVFILLFIAIILITILCIVAIYRYIKKQDKDVEKINNYSDKILDNDYSLDIRDNNESSLSILKNKIYSITVMLKEKNELLCEDKIKMQKLIADISHQIKTPLTSLNILNDLLYDESISKEKKSEILDSMSKELDKIQWLVKNLLNLAKIDSKTLIFKKENINIYNMLKKCKSNFDSMCNIMNVNINIIQNADINMQIIVDEKWTIEAIDNILKNAIEHKAKNIEIKYYNNLIYTQISIKDDGEGIDKEDLSHIFDRFYKAKNSNSDSMGLGLAFVKSVITNQNGEVKVKSKKNEYTQFTIKLYRNNI